MAKNTTKPKSEETEESDEPTSQDISTTLKTVRWAFSILKSYWHVIVVILSLLGLGGGITLHNDEQIEILTEQIESNSVDMEELKTLILEERKAHSQELQKLSSKLEVIKDNQLVISTKLGMAESKGFSNLFTKRPDIFDKSNPLQDFVKPQDTTQTVPLKLK